MAGLGVLGAFGERGPVRLREIFFFSASLLLLETLVVEVAVGGVMIGKDGKKTTARLVLVEEVEVVLDLSAEFVI
jgi:hypothetical protein